MGVQVSQCQGWLGICVGAEALCLVRAWQGSLAQRCTPNLLGDMPPRHAGAAASGT